MMMRSCDDTVASAMMNGFGSPKNEQYHLKPSSSSAGLNGAVSIEEINVDTKELFQRVNEFDEYLEGSAGNVRATSNLDQTASMKINKTEYSAVEIRSDSIRQGNQEALNANASYSSIGSILRNVFSTGPKESAKSSEITSSTKSTESNLIYSNQDLEKEEVGITSDDFPSEEPDEVPCVLPFISVDVIEDMVDPLMDNDSGDPMSNVCHNGDNSNSSDGDSSVEFVSHETAVNDCARSKKHPLPTFRCTECHHVFNSQSELELHTETVDVAVLCVQCDSSFWSPCALNRHRSEHAAAMKHIGYVPGYEANARLSYHVQGGVDRPHTCKHCGVGYTTRFNLMRHVRKNDVLVRNTAPYRCDLCDSTFMSKCLLPIHKAEKHSETNSYNCEVLKNSFADSEQPAESEIVTPQFGLLERESDPLAEAPARPAQNLSYHTFRTATASGISYNCKWCPDKFPTHPALIKHISEDHPEVELFRCEPCNKSFLNKAGLYGHLTHHRYQCNRCDLSFSSNELLINHHGIHGGEPLPSMTQPTLSSSTPKPSPRSASTKRRCEGMSYRELVARIPQMRKPFKCEFCPKTFTYKTTYLEHYLTHTGERPFRCSVCNQGFIRERAMEIHQESHGVVIQKPISIETQRLDEKVKKQTARKSTNSSSRAANRICPIGRATINGALFDPELDVTLEDREAFYYLPIIGLKMLDVSALEDHAYVCPYCDKFFPRASSLCGHKKICSYLTRKRSMAGVSAPSAIKKMVPKTPPSKMIVCRQEDTIVEIANMKHHIIFKGGERLFVCGVCGKQFSRKFTLSEHCRSHTQDRPFHCDRCPRAFKRKSSLFRHRRRNHTKTAPNHSAFAQHPITDENWMSFEPQCNVKIEISDEEDDTPAEEDDIKPVIDLTEGEYAENELNYDYSEMSVFEPQCIVRDELSSDGENSNSTFYPGEDSELIDTSMNHFLEVGLDSGEANIEDDGCSQESVENMTEPDNEIAVNRFLCGECNRRFPRREDLRRHFEEHDSVGPYKCFQCDKKFDRRKYLSKHARNHTKKKTYQCSYCERAYVTNAELTIHVRIHTGERPFECDQCGKGFRVQKQLTLHYRTHTGEKPYSCTHCPSTFSRHETLFRHNRVCQAKLSMPGSLQPLPQLSNVFEMPLEDAQYP